MTKGERIKQSLKETREKRKSQVCRVFKVKVDESRLNKTQKEYLKMVFVEGKRLYNHILSWSSESGNDIFKFNTTNCKSVITINKDGLKEEKDIKFLPAAVKCTVHKQIVDSIKSISKLKERGYQRNGGRLKFKSDFKCLEYRQFRSSHDIKGNNRIRLQGLKKPLLVKGMEQFINIEGIEYANFKLLNTANGYYILVTTFTPKENLNQEKPHLEPIGIDFGCKDSFTFSTGEKVNVVFEETERLKRHHRKMARRKKGSNRYNRSKNIAAREYQKLVNKRNDAANKLVSKLKKHKLIVIQDEQLQNWQSGRNGKVIGNSILGRVKSNLKKLPQTVTLASNIPTTKLCNVCGNVYDIKLWNRTFKCPYCGETHDRDVHAAQNMLWIANNLFERYIPLGKREFKRVEFLEELSKHFNSAESHRTEKREVE